MVNNQIWLITLKRGIADLSSAVTSIDKHTENLKKGDLWRFSKSWPAIAKVQDLKKHGPEATGIQPRKGGQEVPSNGTVNNSRQS